MTVLEWECNKSWHFIYFPDSLTLSLRISLQVYAQWGMKCCARRLKYRNAWSSERRVTRMCNTSTYLRFMPLHSQQQALSQMPGRSLFIFLHYHLLIFVSSFSHRCCRGRNTTRQHFVPGVCYQVAHARTTSENENQYIFASIHIKNQKCLIMRRLTRLIMRRKILFYYYYYYYYYYSTERKIQ